MKWHHFYIELAEARLALMEAGSGNNVLLCLHGYEQRKEVFMPLFEDIPPNWKIVALDLPLYGQTEWLDHEEPIREEFLASFWACFAERYVGAKLHLFGFSMGGKLALSLQSSVRRGAVSMNLMAPDGIKSNFWHRLIRSSWGLRLNDWLDRHPRWILFPAKWVFSLKLIDPLSYRVVKLSYETAAARERKSRQLRIYSLLEVDFAKLKAQKSTKWHLIWGKHDKILHVSLARDFVKLIPQSKLHLLEGGHMLIKEKRMELANLLKQIMHSLSTVDVDK